MAGGLNLYSGLGAKGEYRAHLGHEQLTALVLMLREVRYKATERQPALHIPIILPPAIAGGRIVTMVERNLLVFLVGSKAQMLGGTMIKQAAGSKLS